MVRLESDIYAKGDHQVFYAFIIQLDTSNSIIGAFEGERPFSSIFLGPKRYCIAELQ